MTLVDNLRPLRHNMRRLVRFPPPFRCAVCCSINLPCPACEGLVWPLPWVFGQWPEGFFLPISAELRPLPKDPRQRPNQSFAGGTGKVY